MIEKTRGIALRVAPYSRTSHVVAWLTPDHGRVTTVVKGAQRPKSAFLGQYDLFYSCELLFYARERGGVHITRECSPAATRTGLRGNWKSAACASYLCDIAMRVAMPGAANPRLFELLETGLDFLAGARPDRRFVFWFELRALESAGLSPRLGLCVSCDRALPGGGERGVFFSSGRGGVLCADCSPGADSRAMPLCGDALRAMQKWQKLERPDQGGRRGSEDGRDLEINNALGRFLEDHLQAPPAGRNIVMELVA